MLNRRMQILLNDDIYAYLASLAKNNETSIGEEIRNAVLRDSQMQKKGKLKLRALKEIVKNPLNIAPLTTSDLVNLGRLSEEEKWKKLF